eukprot:1972284-Rhodomonas_salina.1
MTRWELLTATLSDCRMRGPCGMTAQPTTTMTNDALKYACAKREREIERSSIERERVAADLLQRLMLCRPPQSSRVPKTDPLLPGKAGVRHPSD